jgi:hypothetical protein
MLEHVEKVKRANDEKSGVEKELRDCRVSFFLELISAHGCFTFGLERVKPQVSLFLLVFRSFLVTF